MAEEETKSLVVIVDEEARATFEELHRRWFYSENKVDDRDYWIQPPIGEPIEVNGTLVTDHQLPSRSGDVFYIELTDMCQMSCHGCGKGNDLENTGLDEIVQSGARYMSPGYAEKIAEAIAETPSVFRRRILYGGGEPLIDHVQFGILHRIFSRGKKNWGHAVTNGLTIPLDPEEFREFLTITHLQDHGIRMSISPQHMGEYIKALEQNRGRYISDVDNPKDALPAKIIRVRELCNQFNVSFSYLQVYDSDEQMESMKQVMYNAALRYSTKPITGQEAIYLSNMWGLKRFGNAIPDGSAQKLVITTSGKLYPGCLELFSGQFYLGRAGLLLPDSTPIVPVEYGKLALSGTALCTTPD